MILTSRMLVECLMGLHLYLQGMLLPDAIIASYCTTRSHWFDRLLWRGLLIAPTVIAPTIIVLTIIAPTIIAPTIIAPTIIAPTVIAPTIIAPTPKITSLLLNKCRPMSLKIIIFRKKNISMTSPYQYSSQCLHSLKLFHNIDRSNVVNLVFKRFSVESLVCQGLLFWICVGSKPYRPKNRKRLFFDRLRVYQDVHAHIRFI